MKTRIVADGTIETDYNDIDLKRTHIEPTPQNTETPSCPPAIMKAFKRAKKAGKKNDARSHKIAAALRLEREKKHPKKKVPHHNKRVQKMLGDF